MQGKRNRYHGGDLPFEVKQFCMMSIHFLPSLLDRHWRENPDRHTQ